MWTPIGLPPVQPPIKKRPPGRPKKKRAQEPDELRNHRKNRGLGIFKQCKACEKLGYNRRSYKGQAGRNSSLLGNANQAKRTTRKINLVCMLITYYVAYSMMAIWSVDYYVC